jgi:hypothetical protein
MNKFVTHSYNTGKENFGIAFENTMKKLISVSSEIDPSPLGFS